MDYQYTEGGIKTVWTTDATLFLLDLWEENIEAIRGTRKNVLIYKDIAEEMSCFGPTPTEVKNKIDNLTRRYRAESAKMGPSTWEYFSKIKGILSTSTTLVDFFETVSETTDKQPCSSNLIKRKTSSDPLESMERPEKNLRVESIAKEIIDGQNQDKNDSTEPSFDQLMKLKEMDEKLQVRLKQMEIDGMLKVKSMELEMKKMELECNERLRKFELELKYKFKPEL